MTSENSAWEQILKIHGALGRMDYYHMLGLPRDAAPEQIEPQTRKIVSRFSAGHYESAPEQIQRAVAEIRRTLIEAHSILSCADSRRAYDLELANGALRPSVVPRPSIAPSDTPARPSIAPTRNTGSFARPSIAPATPADSIPSISARGFYTQAEKDFLAGDFQQARLHLNMAEAKVPGQPVIQELRNRIDETEASLKDLAPEGLTRLATSRNKTDRMTVERMYGGKVWTQLLSNPEITTAEVARIAAQKNISKELLQSIADREDWLGDPAVREGLLMNPGLEKSVIARVVRLISPVERKRITTGSFPALVRKLASAPR